MIYRSILVLARDKRILQRKFLIVPAVLVLLVFILLKVSGVQANETNSIAEVNSVVVPETPKVTPPSTDVKKLFTHIINGDSTGKWKMPESEQIGRASCRERVEGWEWA